ncbi:MAG: hypothetical protein AAGE80_03125 [Pseudomonadota bacterium]
MQLTSHRLTDHFDLPVVSILSHDPHLRAKSLKRTKGPQRGRGLGAERSLNEILGQVANLSAIVCPRGRRNVNDPARLNHEESAVRRIRRKADSHLPPIYYEQRCDGQHRCDHHRSTHQPPGHPPLLKQPKLSIATIQRTLGQMINQKKIYFSVSRSG